MSLRFAGYAALFGIPDAVRDTLDRRAFDRTLAQRTEPLPLLWQHQPHQRIGTVQWAVTDERGLQIVARIDNLHSRAAAMLRAGTVSGLSFGYIAKDFTRSAAGRSLKAVDLLEISLVTWPVQHGSRVHLLH